MINALTGLRFLAAAVVVLVHAGNLAAGKDLGIGLWAANAVTLFFVLSGFILTYVYAERMDSPHANRKFLLARFARIWPTHLVCLLAAWSLQLSLGDIHWNPTMGTNLTFHTLMVHSWVPSYQTAFWFNGPSWSISTEFAFYLLFPFLFPLVMKRPGAAGASIIATTLLGLFLLDMSAKMKWIIWDAAVYFSYVNPLFRVWDFCLGILVGRFFLTRQSKFSRSRSLVWELLATAAVLGGYFLIARHGINGLLPGDEKWVVLNRRFQDGLCLGPAYALLIYVLARSSGPLANLLGHPTSVFLGEISFAFYLVQQPILHMLRDWSDQLQLSTTLLFLSAVVLTFSFAVLLHYLVELPMRTWIVGWTKPRTQRSWATASLYRQALGTPMTWLAAVMIGGLLISLNADINFRKQVVWQETQQEIREFAAENPVQPVEFQNHAILHTFKTQKTESGMLLQLVWEKLPGWKRQRFVHLIGSDGNIVHQGLPETQKFRDAKPGDYLLDEVLIEQSTLSRSSRIGIGFYSPEEGTIPIVSMPGISTSMNGRRLEVMDLASRQILLARPLSAASIDGDSPVVQTAAQMKDEPAPATLH